tara:strand:- start:1756 stop:2118 length:363 start_codon:yes stop_codon:yes gene_type:complete
MGEKRTGLFRIIADQPLYSKYKGICNVCKKNFNPGEQISPYFENTNNYWRHTNCLQLFYIIFKFKGKCGSCNKDIQPFTRGYWSKHNGTWCSPCGEKLFPKVVVVNSRAQKNLKKIKKFG